MTRSKVILFFAVAAMVGSMSAAAVPAGAATPSVTVTPSRLLSDGQVVTVNWKGFSVKPNQPFGVTECAGANQTDGCDFADSVSVPATRSGSVQLTLHKAYFDVSDQGVVVCRRAPRPVHDACVVTVFGLPGQQADAPIVFKGT